MNTKLPALLAGALLALSHPLQALAQASGQQTPPWEWMGPGHMWGAGWAFWWIFPLCMLLMIAACVAIFFFGHRSGGAHHNYGPWHMGGPGDGMHRPWGDPAASALQILNERYAKGEIQKTEYEERKATILSRG